MGVLATMAAATPNQRRVTLCLDGETQAKVDEIAAAFDAAITADKQAGTVEDPTPTFDALIDQHEALRDQIAASSVTFVFQAMGWADRVALQAAHPPRTGNLADLSRQYNFETYLPALIRASVVEVIGADGETQPASEVPQSTWDGLLGVPPVTREQATETMPEHAGVKASLNAAQMSLLITEAEGVNERSPAVPPSALSLRVTRDSGESSTPSGPGTSRRAGSTAGSRRTSPTSSGGRKPTQKRAPAKKASLGKSVGS